MTRDCCNLRHGRSGATQVNNRSAPQVHVKKPTLNAVLARNLINTRLGADLCEEVSEVIWLVWSTGLLADDVDGSVLGRPVQHLRELGKDRNPDHPVGTPARLLRPDLHYIPPALSAMHRPADAPRDQRATDSPSRD